MFLQDDHVVAGARAMMQYSRKRETSNPQTAVAPAPNASPSQYAQQSAGTRWANTGSAPPISSNDRGNSAPSTRNPPPRIMSAAAAVPNATTTIRKVDNFS